MANQRKLGRTADQRKALLRNQVTNLIWNGRITTTEAKAKEVRRIADKMITLAVRECENTVSTTKETHNDKGQAGHPRSGERCSVQTACPPHHDGLPLRSEGSQECRREQG